MIIIIDFIISKSCFYLFPLIYSILSFIVEDVGGVKGIGVEGVGNAGDVGYITGGVGGIGWKMVVHIYSSLLLIIINVK